MGLRKIYDGETMSNKTMNKKGQMYPRPSYSNVHPVLIIGIILFIIPFLLPILKINNTPFINLIFNIAGVLTIIIGGMLSIFKASN